MRDHDSFQCTRRARLLPVIQPAMRKTLRSEGWLLSGFAGPGWFEDVLLLVVLGGWLVGMGLLP